MCAKIIRVRRCAYAARWPAVPLASARSCRALLEVYAVEERRGQEPWKLTSFSTLWCLDKSIARAIEQHNHSPGACDRYRLTRGQHEMTRVNPLFSLHWEIHFRNNSTNPVIDIRCFLGTIRKIFRVFPSADRWEGGPVDCDRHQRRLFQINDT